MFDFFANLIIIVCILTKGWRSGKDEHNARQANFGGGKNERCGREKASDGLQSEQKNF